MGHIFYCKISNSNQGSNNNTEEVFKASSSSASGSEAKFKADVNELV